MDRSPRSEDSTAEALENQARLQAALLDPANVYKSPFDVLDDAALSSAQKIEVLRRWEYDACELSVAEEEGMPGSNGLLLQQVLEALHTLVADIDTEHTPPTKQGGLDRAAVAPRTDA